MKCRKCEKDFPEKEIQESHDVPCYMFAGISRREKKNQADKFGRHWLCEECHEEYEDGVNLSMRFNATSFSKKFFGVQE